MKPLSFSDSEWLDSLVHIENITDSYSQYFVNDESILKTMNSIKSANYHLNRFLPASVWSALSSLIISEESTAC